MSNLKVVLLRSVDKLGVAGDVVDVRRGYYRNFLGPRQMAVLASSGNLKLVESQKKKLAAMVLRERGDAEKLRDSIAGTVVTFAVRANDKGQLFGAITSADIAQKLHDQGFDIDRRKVEMGGTLKTLGPHKIRLRLYPEIFAEVTVQVDKLLQPGEEALMEAAKAASAAAAASPAGQAAAAADAAAAATEPAAEAPAEDAGKKEKKSRKKAAAE